MLVLAGVSLNAIVGDNGIISNAQEAKLRTGMAVLEEYLQTKYVENFENINGFENKAEKLIDIYPQYFYIPAIECDYTGWNCVTDTEGHALYVIKKEKLPEDIRSQLVGGDAGDKNYETYSSLNDVYGITSDLKVYYSTGEKLYGISSRDDLDKINPNKTLLTSDSQLMTILKNDFDTDNDGELSMQEIGGLKSLTIEAESSVDTLVDLYNLSSLEKLVIRKNLGSLDGIEKCLGLKTVIFENCQIGSYEALGKLGSKVTEIQILNPTDDELNNFGLDLQNYNLNNLRNLFIGGRLYYITSNQYRDVNDTQSELTSLEGLSYLSQQTKEAVKWLFVCHNKITSLEDISGFKNVEYLRANRNNLTSLKGIENYSKLKYLQVAYNNLQDSDTNPENELETEYLNCLKALTDKSSLEWLDLTFNSGIKWISYLNNCSNLNTIYIVESDDLDIDDLNKVLSLMVTVPNKLFNSKYADLFVTNDSTYVNYFWKTDLKSSDVSKLVNCTKLEILNLNYATIVDSEGTPLSQEATNTLLNNLLKTKNSNNEYIFKDLKELGLNGINVTDLSFLKNLTNLNVLDLRDIPVGTYNDDNPDTNGIEVIDGLTNLFWLGLKSKGGDTATNPNIDLSLIQNVINSLSTNCDNRKNWKISDNSVNSMEKVWDYTIKAYKTQAGTNASYGLICQDENALKSLNCCSNIRKLAMFGHSPHRINFSSSEINLSGCSSLKSLNICSVVFKKWILPNSLENIYLQYLNGEFQFQNGSLLKTFKLYGVEGTNNLNETFKSIAMNCSLCWSFDLVEYADNQTDFSALMQSQLLDSSNTLHSNVVKNSVTYFKYSFLSWKASGSWTPTDTTISSLKSLQAFSNLQNLELSTIRNKQSLSDILDLDGLAELSNLRKLVIEYTDIINIPNLNKLSHLTYLCLGFCAITNISSLEGLTSLKTLYLNNNQIKTGLHVLSDFTELGDLVLSNNSLDDNSAKVNGEGQTLSAVLIALNNTGNKKLKTLSVGGNSGFIGRTNLTDSSLSWTKLTID